MAAPAKQIKLDELLAKAQAALRSDNWFDAERHAIKFMTMARQEQDFERMAAGVAPLQEARRNRFQAALQITKITVVSTPIHEEMKINPGCYIVQPPQVGLDARRLRLAALNNDIPVAVVCREPLTASKLTPVVAISPNITIRAKVAPSPRPNSPSMAWFVGALQSLGDTAIELLDTTLPVIRRIDSLVDLLDALPEHENLHHALELACRHAHETKAREKPAPGSKTKIKS